MVKKLHLFFTGTLIGLQEEGIEKIGGVSAVPSTGMGLTDLFPGFSTLYGST